MSNKVNKLTWIEELNKMGVKATLNGVLITSTSKILDALDLNTPVTHIDLDKLEKI